MNKVIIVEDDRSFSDLLSSYIESLSEIFEVKAVRDVQSFIVEYNKGEPTYLFLDILLPGIDGLELLKFLKGLKSPTKIFIMTGVAGMYNQASQIADGYLEKPFELSRVKELLMGHHE